MDELLQRLCKELCMALAPTIFGNPALD